MDGPYRGSPAFERGLELLGFDPFERLDEGTRFQQPAIFLCSVRPGTWRQEAPDELAQVPRPPATRSASTPRWSPRARCSSTTRCASSPSAPPRWPTRATATRAAWSRCSAATTTPSARWPTRLGLTVANDNAPGQLVLAARPKPSSGRGRPPATRPAPARGACDVAGAFHSPLMEPAAERLARRARRARRSGRPRSRSTPTAAPRPFADVRRELSREPAAPVRWRETLLALRAAGVERFVELGPGAVLTGLVKRTLAAA